MRRRYHTTKPIFLAGSACVLALLSQSYAADTQPQTGPLEFGTPAVNLAVGGTAYTTLSAAFQPDADHLHKNNISGAITLDTRLTLRPSADQILLLEGSFFAYHDRFTADNYENDFVQKVYASWISKIGQFDVGMADGAAYSLSLTGPVVDDEISPESHNTTFFPDINGRHLIIDSYALNSSVEVSFNYAKIAYYTPEWHGLTLGASYAPGEGKWVIPFVDAGSSHSGRQSNIWEIGGAYKTNLGRMTAAISGGAGFSHAVEADKSSQQKGLTDWSAGVEFSLPLTANDTLGFGGAYHVSNAFGFCIDDTRKNGQTDSAHVSLRYNHESWSFGTEYSDGTAYGGAVNEHIGVRAYAAAVGYRLNSNWQASLGWQQMRYNANTLFYNGATRIHMDAVFLHLHFDQAKPEITQL